MAGLGGMFLHWHFDGLRNRKAFGRSWGMILHWAFDGLRDRKAFAIPWGQIQLRHFDGLRDRKAFARPLEGCFYTGPSTGSGTGKLLLGLWRMFLHWHFDGLGDRKAFGRPWGMIRQWPFDWLREWHGFCQPKKPTPDWRGGVAVAGRQWRG